MKTIVICGSMKFKEDIIKTSESLKKLGYETLLPVECMEGKPKEIASRAHFKRIERDNTDAILVINMDKQEKENYIGPNSFAEIALAFYYNKKIFLLNEIYKPYQDELIGWKAISLEKNLNNITRYL